MAFTRPKASQINFDVTNISDTLIRLNSGQTGSADKDVGLVIERGDDTNTAFLYDESADQFVLVNTTEDGSTSGNVNISSYAGLQANAIVYGSLNDGTTTLSATVAELNYVDGVTSNIQTQIDNISSSFTLAADSGTNDTFTTGETLTIAGGTGIDTTVSDNNISVAIDSTVATLTGTQTLTNKTLTSPTINAFSGTGNGSITGTLSIVTTTTGDSLLITTTEDSSSAAPVITLKRNSSSVADADYLGQIKFAGENDADQEVIYAKITGKILDASDGTEDGIIEITHKKAGNNNISARFRSDSLQLINGTQLTVDGTATFNGITVNSSQTINMGSNAITSVADPSSAQDAATKAYVDSQVSSVPTGDITAVNITAGTGLSGTVSTASGDHTQTLSIDSTVATLTGSQTLTNKTLTAPVISSISNTGTLTLPTSTGTVALTSDIPTNVSELTNDSSYLTSFTETNDLSSAVTWANVPNANITESSVTQHQAALSITESQISDLGSYITASSSDTLTNKTLGATTAAGHIIPDTDEAYDLGSSSLKFRDLYLSGSSLNLDAFSIETHASGITFNHSTNTTLLPVGGGSHEILTLTGTQTLTNKTINTASNTITIVEADISDLQSYLTSYTVSESDVTTHQAALSITESQISDLGSYITGIDSSAVTTALGFTPYNATNPSGYITGYTVIESDVTAHQAALSITESQISDLGTYLTASDINGKLNLSGGTMSGAIAMGTNKITGMGDPTAAQDAATKAYVDSQVSGGGGGNAFTTISVTGQSDVVADSSTDTLTLSNSGLVVITTTAGTDTIDIGTPSTAAVPFTLADGSTSNIDLYTSGKINSVFTNLYVPFAIADGSAVTTMVVGGS